MLNGIDNIRNNLKRKQAQGLDFYEKALRGGALIGEANVKDKWSNRSQTGKGFQTRTGGLVRSISNGVVRKGNGIMGFVCAGIGIPYANRIEFMSGRKYAYLWPGVNEARGMIWEHIKDKMGGLVK